MISMDDYYKELTEEQYRGKKYFKTKKWTIFISNFSFFFFIYLVLHDDSAEINFDTPERINFDLLKSNLNDIKNNNPVELPKVSSAVRTRNKFSKIWTESEQNLKSFWFISV